MFEDGHTLSFLTSQVFSIKTFAQRVNEICGVVTPFKGIRAHARRAMGMPGSETSLEELMCRGLGDFLEEGMVVKLANGLY